MKGVKLYCKLPESINGFMLFPFCVINSKLKGTEKGVTTYRHENIHFKQALELLIIGFYILYLVEYLTVGYWGNRFETEAYAHEDEPHYLAVRKPYAWRNYG